MTPRIGAAIAQGFRVATRSWAGIGFYAASVAAVGAIALIGVLLTSPPRELFQSAAPPTALAPAAVTSGTTAPLPPVSATPPAAAPLADAPAAVPANPSGGAATALPTPAATPVEAAPAVARTPEELARQRETERNRIIGEWVLRTWPALMLIVLWLAASTTWLAGGQLAYLVKRVRNETVQIAEFWTTGLQVFPALLGASALGLGMWFPALAVVGLMAVLFVSLSAAIPEWVLIVIGLLCAAAATVGIVWFIVRVAFWFVAIVAGRLGAIAGLRASFRATRGRWWRVCGLLVVLTIMGMGVNLVFGILEGLAALAGEVPGAIATIVLFLPNAIAGMYVGFATIAALVHFYGQCVAEQASGTSSTAS